MDELIIECADWLKGPEPTLEIRGLDT
jgi:hypothetical protein